MKKNIYQSVLLALLIVTSNAAGAQVPQLFNYQAVVRNSSGSIMANQAVSLRFTIHDASAIGTTLYRETQTGNTNQFGLVAAKVGGGTVVSGTFNTINWSATDRYLQVEIDPAGGSNFADLGASQLLSVPYALYSGSSGNTLTGGDGISIHNDTVNSVWSSSNGGQTISTKAHYVGIGTNNPYSDLSIVDSVSNQPNPDPIGISVVCTNPTGGSNIVFGESVYNTPYPAASITKWNSNANGWYPPNGPYIKNALQIDNGGDIITSTNNHNIYFMTFGQHQGMIVDTLGNVGINTFSPGAVLDVAGNVKIADGTQAQGRVLTSDANGVASWQNDGKHYVGERFGGGVVFYVYDNGYHGLIMDTLDIVSGITWSNGSNTTTNAFKNGINGGAANTTQIIISQGAGNYAAFATSNYVNDFGDWYLPSTTELQLAYNNRGYIPGLGSNYVNYWSSTEASTSQAYVFVMGGIGFGSSYPINKNSTVGVIRAVRAF